MRGEDSEEGRHLGMDMDMDMDINMEGSTTWRGQSGAWI